MVVSGIGVIKNINNGKEFVFKSFNLEKQYEIYQKQLDLNIHHNKELQRDWIKEGKKSFEFNIIEEIEDEFILSEEFDDYLFASKNYNSLEISDFFFEYLSDDLLSLLYQAMGKDFCNTQFEQTLKFYDLPVEYYDLIKKDMILLIENDEVSDENLMDKLNDMLLEHSNSNRIRILDLQEKLFDDLHSFTGIGNLSTEFKSLLDENNLSEEIGFKIRENIEKLIFLNNVLENNISVQIEDCIKRYHEKINDETIKKLMENVDSLKDNKEFLDNVNSLNLTSKNVLSIMDQMIDLISSMIVTEENFNDKLIELIDIEAENAWLETKQELVNYVSIIIGENEINKEFETRLENNYLDLNLAFKFKDILLEVIENKQIKTNEEIDLELDKLIDNEISSINESKEQLLYELEQDYGDEELSDSFKNILYENELEDKDGIDMIQILRNEISSFKIKSVDGIEARIDEMIFNKNKTILFNKFYDLLGKEKNNESFSKKLKLNYLTENDGNEIKNELLNFILEINDTNKLLEEKNSLEQKIDELICTRKEQYNNKLMNLTNELLDNLSEVIGDEEINDSFKSKLYSNNLGDGYVNLIKNEISVKIKKHAPQDSYEIKLEQLTNLKTKSIPVIINEIIQRESKLREEELKLLRLELISQLNDLIGAKENSNYFNQLLAENNLDENAASSIRNEFMEIIESDKVYDSNKFNFKYDELQDIKLKSVKSVLFDLINAQKSIYMQKLENVRLNLIEELYSIIGKDSVSDSFKKRLYSNELNADFAKTIETKILDFINSNVISDNQYSSKLNELEHIKDDGIDIKINELIKSESKIKIEELHSLKKQLTNELIQLTNNQSYSIKLKSNNLSSEIGIRIKNEINDLINSNEVIDSKFDYKTKELLHLKEIGIDNKIDELIDVNVELYNDNIAKIRKILIINVNKIIGLINLNKEFKTKLNDNFLSDDYGKLIKNEMFEFINSDDVYDNQFEFKLDELSSYNDVKIVTKINSIIKRESNLKLEQLYEIRKDLNDELLNLIGEKDNDYFINLLKENSLTSKNGNSIRNEISQLINNDTIFDSKFPFKLDELLALKQKTIKKQLDEIISRYVKEFDKKINLLREKLLDNLKSTLSTDSFKQELYKKQIDESYITTINDDLTNLINSTSLRDDNYEVKLKELEDINNNGIDYYINDLIKIEEDKKQKELFELRQELSTELFNFIGTDRNNMLFNMKLKSYNTNKKTQILIRDKLIELVSSDEPFLDEFDNKLAELKHIKEYGLNNTIEDVIKEENEIYNVNLNQKRELLIDSLNSTIDGNKIGFDLKYKLKTFNLEEEYGLEIKNTLNELITSDEVCDNKFISKLDELEDLEKTGIKNKIDEIIHDESEKRKAILKENLLKELYDITGKTPLCESFIEKLNNANFDEKFGQELINHFESKIDSLEIREGFDFNSAIDEMLYDENKNILLNQTYELIGKESNNDYYKKLLKDNMITSEKGEEIREELMSLINNSDLAGLVEMKKRTMFDVLDKIISEEFSSRQNQLINLKSNLLQDLNDLTNSDSFNSKLKSYNLNSIYSDKFEQDIRDLIQSDEIKGDYEFKVDELIAFEKIGVEAKLDELMSNKSREINQDIKQLRNQFLEELKKYSKNLTTKYVDFGISGVKIYNRDLNHELKKRDLNTLKGQKAIDELKEIITSDEIIDSRFNTKYEELSEIERVTLKNKFIEKLDEYQKNQKELIDYLTSQINSPIFYQRLKNNNLNTDISKKIHDDLKEMIKNDQITFKKEIDNAITNYILKGLENRNKAINKLHEKVGSHGISLKFRAILMVNGLSSNEGKQIFQNVENKIRRGLISENEVGNEIDRQIRKFVQDKKKKNSNSFKSTKPKYVFCSQCGNRNQNGDNFCTQCGARLPKL